MGRDRKLENKGLVRRTYDRRNARRVCLILTGKGRTAFKTHRDVHRRMEQFIRDCFADDFAERNRLLQSVFTELNRILNAMEKAGLY